MMVIVYTTTAERLVRSGSSALHLPQGNVWLNQIRTSTTVSGPKAFMHRCIEDGGRVGEWTTKFCGPPLREVHRMACLSTSLTVPIMSYRNTTSDFSLRHQIHRKPRAWLRIKQQDQAGRHRLMPAEQRRPHPTSREKRPRHSGPVVVPSFFIQPEGDPTGAEHSNLRGKGPSRWSIDSDDAGSIARG